MNASITDNVRSAILSVSAKEWQKLFESLRIAEFRKLSGTADSELTKVKYRVIVIDELEALFTTARQQPPTDNNEDNENDT